MKKTKSTARGSKRVKLTLETLRTISAQELLDINGGKPIIQTVG